MWAVLLLPLSEALLLLLLLLPGVFLLLLYLSVTSPVVSLRVRAVSELESFSG